MKDPLWEATWAAVSPHLRESDLMLLPPGDWPPSVATRTYKNEIRIGRANVLILHKANLACLDKKTLRGIMRTWRFLYANEVFVCFRKEHLEIPKPQPIIEDRHACTLHEYLHSSFRKRIRNTVFFCHIPKTAGTSIWEFLSNRVVASIYYETFESFLANPPRPGEYDLVGGHVPLPLLAAHAGPDDRLVGIVRDPVLRFRSAFMHSRRQAEDPSTFSPVMQAMRDLPLRQFLETRDGHMELRQQLLMLGFDFARGYSAEMDEEVFQNGERALADKRCLFRTVGQVDAFAQDLADMLAIAAPSNTLGFRNVLDTGASTEALAEFDEAAPTVASGCDWDRKLYALVAARYPG
ncbi:hypothetical protein HN018_09365 [Lichenicola cladoniae]|uniref:Sulfotransferase family protein n=1 Tax=Lichenicola cladoniae TaxID=1484109 RepID=A0A6M8HPN2_9PROT|nr:hypothetical protein [Lichenicola cladoniae]NPD66565.1 hypothetical protein [Acetobacteraceae bacterium]QKE90225.1 hypothetical protein HN018_09365 [Lichenicola cladoniae]